MRVVDISNPENLAMVETLEGVYGNVECDSGRVFTGIGYIIVAESKVHRLPKVTQVIVRQINCTSVVVEWETDIPAISSVKYGTLSSRYEYEVSDLNLTKHHTILLHKLHPETKYYFLINPDSSERTFETCIQQSKSVFDNIISFFRKILEYFANVS